MSSATTTALDDVLRRAVDGSPGVPGVAAIVTDRDANTYEGAAGTRRLGGDDGFTTDTVCAIFSTTKAIGGTACLQLVEDGSLDLDAPAKEYVPDIGELQVLDGFDADGEPVLRPPKRDITTRMLLSHTAGFGYDFFSEAYNTMATEHDQPSVITASKASIMTPLLFDPGEQWEYGSNIDWAGQVVEAIAGERLGVVMQERILGPLAMDSTAFSMTDDMRSRLAAMHQRDETGELTATDFELPSDPDIHMAGHGLYSTADDYMKFIRMWLNDGDGPDGRILQSSTVEMAVQNQLGDLKVKMLPGVIPSLSNDAEFFPGMPKSWALTFMLNDEDAPTGRPAGVTRMGGAREPLLLDRPRERDRWLLGDADLPVRGPGLRRRIPRLRDGGVRRARLTRPHRSRHRHGPVLGHRIGVSWSVMSNDGAGDAATPSNLALEHQLCLAVNRAARAINGCYRPPLGEIGLTYAQYTVMLALWEHRTVTMKRLCEILHLDSGTLSPLVKRMADAGLLTRTRSDDDERLLDIAVTEKGDGLRDVAADVQSGVEARTGLAPADLARLRTELDDLTTRLNEPVDSV